MLGLTDSDELISNDEMTADIRTGCSTNVPSQELMILKLEQQVEDLLKVKDQVIQEKEQLQQQLAGALAVCRSVHVVCAALSLVPRSTSMRAWCLFLNGIDACFVDSRTMQNIVDDASSLSSTTSVSTSASVEIAKPHRRSQRLRNPSASASSASSST